MKEPKPVRFKKQANILSNSYYMYGKHTVIAALHNKNRSVQKLYCVEKQSQYLKATFPDLDINIVSSDFIIDKIGKNQTHQGIMALVKTVFQHQFEYLTFKEQDRVAILDQITDPQNIGAIIRSGVAFGIDKFILPADNTPDENAIIAKAACGCLELATIIKVTNLKQIIDKLKKQNFWVAGLVSDGQNMMSELHNIKKLAIIIGSEGKGLRSLTRKNCDFLVQIPINQHVDSLNAAIAASIVFYETN